MKNDGLILLVENEPDDVFIVQRAVKKVGIENPMATVENGELAVDYLSGRGAFQDRAAHPLPALVLLDLSMPRMGGLEVLKWIRAQPQIKRLIVVVLTSSQNHEDIAKAYDNGANGYLVKPVGATEFQAVLSSLKIYWLEKNQNPRCEPEGHSAAAQQ
jgi:CheY-like chemotaxis protein